MIRTDDVTQDDRVVPVRLLVAHQERVVLPWINLHANRWRHKQSLATSLATQTVVGDFAGNTGRRWRSDEFLMIFVTIMNPDVTKQNYKKRRMRGFALPLEGGNVFRILARFEVELHESRHWLVGRIQK